MGEEELHQLIKGCIEQDRNCQKMLYKAFYGFSMAICLRYTGDRDEAAEVLNMGFLKVLTHIKTYDIARPFKGWLGKIMTNTSIDYYRANLKMAYSDDLDKAEHISDGELPDRKLNYDDLLVMVQKLPQAYRTVFNLFAIDGYSHEEIGEMLGINPGTSKSNLHKARHKLKQMILEADQATVKTERGNYNGLGYSPIVAISTTEIKTGFFNNGIRG